MIMTIEEHQLKGLAERQRHQSSRAQDTTLQHRHNQTQNGA
jgi:hypothetical protein